MTPREEFHRRAILHDQAAFILLEEDPLFHEEAVAHHEFEAKRFREEAALLGGSGQ